MADEAAGEAAGEAVHPDGMSKRFTAATRAGLHKPGLGVHSLRHHAITSWLRQGVPVATVSKIAGHEDISITLRLYALVREDDNRLSPAETPPERTGVDLPKTEAGTVQVRVSERTWGFNSPLAHVSGPGDDLGLYSFPELA